MNAAIVLMLGRLIVVGWQRSLHEKVRMESELCHQGQTAPNNNCYFTKHAKTRKFIEEKEVHGENYEKDGSE